mgnify:CR=1 FL=1
MAPSDGITLGWRELAKLFLRAWPYLRPQLKHLLTWGFLAILIEILFVVAALVTFDLFNNKVLLGQKLEPIQATILFLDDTFVRESIPETAVDPDGANVDATDELEARWDR